MANILDATGLTVNTKAEIISLLTTGFQSIYGPDINVSSDTPDGQLINLFAQVILDLEDLLVQIYNSFDPDFAIGVTLWQRCAINGVQVKGGTYTVTPVTIVTSQSVNLYGLDQTAQTVYTVSDNAGNLWVLQETVLGAPIGSNIYNFQSTTPGAVTTVPNTITVQVSIVLGVTSVNNPTTYTTLGINQESDAALKIRRQQSVSLSSQGYLQGLTAALLNINGMSFAIVYENVTSITDADGIPGHSIWVITSGSAAPVDIANAIYVKRNAGCGMKGSESYVITQVNGIPFTVYWDDVISVNLFIAFTATSLNGTNPPNISGIVAGLPSSFIPGVHSEVNINALATSVQSIDSNTLVTNAGFSTGQTQILTLSGVAASGAFVISYNGNVSASINWNDAIGTIQTKVQAVTGLSSALVTGSIASQTLNFNLTAIVSVQALIYVTTNTLATSGPVAITFSYNEGYANTLTPASKQYQFVLAPSNIVITPIVLLPMTSIVQHTTGTVTFAAQGGYGTYVYSILTNNSGATINSSSGLYTAGVTFPVTDTIKVVDSFGNTQTATVSVI